MKSLFILLTQRRRANSLTCSDAFILLVDAGGGGQVEEEGKLLEGFILLLDAEESDILVIDVEEGANSSTPS